MITYHPKELALMMQCDSRAPIPPVGVKMKCSPRLQQRNDHDQSHANGSGRQRLERNCSASISNRFTCRLRDNYKVVGGRGARRLKRNRKIIESQHAISK